MEDALNNGETSGTDDVVGKDASILARLVGDTDALRRGLRRRAERRVVLGLAGAELRGAARNA